MAEPTRKRIDIRNTRHLTVSRTGRSMRNLFETEVVVPPKKGAVLSYNSISFLSHRDHHITEIQCKGEFEWKRQFGYYLQSHAKNAFYRYEKIIGGCFLS